MRYVVYLILFCVSFNGVSQIQVGAEQTHQYLSLIKDKTVALVVNQTSVIKETHLVDSLKSLGINIKAMVLEASKKQAHT